MLRRVVVSGCMYTSLFSHMARYIVFLDILFVYSGVWCGFQWFCEFLSVCTFLCMWCGSFCLL